MGECFLCGNPLAPGAGVTSIMRHPRCKPGAVTSALKKGLASPSHGGRQRDAVLLRTPGNYNATSRYAISKALVLSFAATEPLVHGLVSWRIDNRRRRRVLSW